MPKKSIEKNKGIPAVDFFLKTDTSYKLNESIYNLISYIEKERERFDFETDDINAPFVIKIPPVMEDAEMIENFEAQKFLVHLLKQQIISDLYLPAFIEKKNQKTIIISGFSTYFDYKDALRDAIEHPKQFEKQITKFTIENWDNFLKIKRDLDIKRKGVADSKEKKDAIQSPIRKTALQNMAYEIKEFTSHSGLNGFFGDLDIPKELYAEGSKYDKVFSVLSNVNQATLFKIIEEAMHPLRFFGGDEERALQIQDLFSSFLQYDGYCIYDGKVVKATPETLKEIKARIEKRKKEQVNQISDNKEFIPTKEPFPIRIVGETEIKGLEKGLEKLVKIQKQEKKEKQTKETTLYLNQNGDLYKEPKERYRYPMSESEGRHKIVRYFVENKIYNYYPTPELATALEKDETLLMKEIGKINTIIQTKLKLKDKILDGKRGSGYRINPNYKIILKNE